LALFHIHNYSILSLLIFTSFIGFIIQRRVPEFFTSKRTQQFAGTDDTLWLGSRRKLSLLRETL